MKAKEPEHFHAHFALFHHDISAYMSGVSTINSTHLEALQSKVSSNEKNISQVLLEIVKEKIEGVQNNEIGLTLTGGFDSRVILSALLFLGKKPICFTYGNPQNRDIKIAAKICRTFDLKHLNVSDQPPTAESYLNNVKETLVVDKGNSHLHRAHRMLAIKEITNQHKIKVLFTGHFGGEQIRGLSYNNYFASRLFKGYNEEDLNIKDSIEPILKSYFIRDDYFNKEKLISEVMNLQWMKHTKEKNRLYFLYDLVAKNHHMQDVRIYSQFVAKVIPVYLDERFVKILMQSSHHFMRKKRNKLTSLSHPKLYCSIISDLCPKLLNIELSNGYKPSDYQKGLLFYGVKRIFNKYIRKSFNPPSFSYGSWYVQFIKENAERIDESVWEIYDKKAYFQALYNSNHKTDEGYWHKFSNPILFDLKNKRN